MRRTFGSKARFGACLCSLALAATQAGCASSDGGSNRGGSSGNGSVGSGGSPILGTAGSGGSKFIGAAGSTSSEIPPCDPCTDFPADPVIDEGVDAAIATSFHTGSGSTPCVIEPQDGALFPNNWQRPRIRTSGASGPYRITVHADKETQDLVVYTNKNPWNMPRDLWSNLAAHVQDQPIKISIAPQGGVETTITITVAPVDAGGAVVFWASTTSLPGLTSTALYGFQPGDDGVTLTLNPGMVKGVILDDSPTPKRALTKGGSATEDVPAGQVRCVGCHASTPDGAAVAITDHWPWNIKIASIVGDTAGQEPSYVTPLGSLIAQMPWQGITTFSAGDGWPTDGSSGTNYRYISSFGKRPDDALTFDPNATWNSYKIWSSGTLNKTNEDDLIWVDLAAKEDSQYPVPTLSATATVDQAKITTPIMAAKGTGWDIISRSGDTRGAIAPKWSHDGKTIAYTSTDATSDGRVGAAKVCDIYTVPFNGGKGGTASAVKGANDATAAEYYPDFSADDQWLAFNRVATPGGQDLYFREDGEIYVVQASGGTPIRLAANDPPKCTNEASPGILNTWPKWSPLAKQANGKTYYFLVFSSARQSWGKVQIGNAGDNKYEPAAQLYITAIVWDGTNSPTTYPAIYLWNQGNLISGSEDAGDATVTTLQTSNVTPAWNDFVIPAQPAVPEEDIH